MSSSTTVCLRGAEELDKLYYFCPGHTTVKSILNNILSFISPIHSKHTNSDNMIDGANVGGWCGALLAVVHIKELLVMS